MVLNVTKVNIEDLKPAPYNPRIITDSEMEKLKRSIQEFGYVQPIIANKRNNVVVGGNQRLRALKELGYKEIEVIFISLDEQEEMALNVALNQIGGSFDNFKLEEVVKQLKLKDFDIELIGFDMKELNKKLNHIAKIKPKVLGNEWEKDLFYQLHLTFDVQYKQKILDYIGKYGKDALKNHILSIVTAE